MERAVPHILIVEGDQTILDYLSRLMEREGFKPLVAGDGETALKKIPLEKPDVMLLNVKLPGMNGMEVLQWAKEFDPGLPVIMVTANADISGAVEAIRHGAHDYLSKPFKQYDVTRIVRSAVLERDIKRRLREFPGRSKSHRLLREMMGPSKAVGNLITLVDRVAHSDYTVIIQGETGTGKELLAQAIHNSSKRSKSPFIAVDCGAIPETLLESELFGHEKGAFTGAEYQRTGKFELVKDGTLLLDEISNMPLNSQIKLLRVIQEKKVYRLGGAKPLEIDVRLLAASNQELKGLTESGAFRRDLFYRLNDFTITVPPVRERKEDIPHLANRFLNSAIDELHKQSVSGFSKPAMEAMLSYDWPGNVRQLRSTVRRAVLLADGLITEKHLDISPPLIPPTTYTPRLEDGILKNLSLKEIVRQKVMAIERDVLTQALRHTGGNKAKAARMLQIDYKTLHTKVKRLGISPEKDSAGETSGRRPEKNTGA